MATRTSIANGAWNSAGSWDTGIPGDGDTAVINHNIYIDSNVTVGTGASSSYAITINSGGVLRWANPPSGNWTLTLKGGVDISAGGKFQIGTQSNPIPSTYVADVYFAAPSDNLWWQINIQNGGEFDAWGSRYHMDTEESQRAKLVGDISAGSVAFELDRDVDWHVGDWIAIGCGGDKTYTPNRTQHRPEKVQITGQTSARNYTATFSYLHKSGDHVISLERNVVIRGNGQYRGVRIHAYSSGLGTSLTKCRLSWAAIRYAGQISSYTYAAVYWDSTISNPTADHPADSFIVKNLVLDTAGEISTSGPPNDRPLSYGIAINSGDTPFADTYCISDINAYAMGVVVSVNAAYTLDIQNIVGIDTGSNVVRTGTVRNIHLDSVWGCARDWQNTYAKMLEGDFTQIDYLECFNAYRALSWADDSYGYTRHNDVSMYDGKIYAMYDSPVYFAPANSECPRVSLVGWEVYQARQPFYLGGSGTPHVEFIDCSFDACNSAGYSTDGAIKAYAFHCGLLLFDTCTFGTQARNQYANVRFSVVSGTLERQHGRVCAVNCTFVEPVDWSSAVGSYLYYHKTFLWSLFYSAHWPERCAFPMGSSFELTQCVVKSATNVDQWALDYSTARHVAMVGGGGEMVDEPTTKIDGTFCRKLWPFHCAEPCWANAHAPIPIPVTAGATVTVKLSMRKTNGQLIAQPGIRLEGPGVFEEAYLSEGLLNTWEELTVSGTAASDGTCYLLVSAGTNNAHTASSGATDPMFGPPPVSSSWQDMFSSTVYADGLKITVA